MPHPDILMLSLDAALRVLDERKITAHVQFTRPHSVKFPLLDDHFVVRTDWTSEVDCTLVVAAKMGKEVR